MTLLLALLFFVGPLEEKIDKLLAAAEAQQAHWGIHVVDAHSGHILYSRNANRLFQPASNMKLFTTALALERLGPNHRYNTTLQAASSAASSIDADGVLRGDLRLVGD